MGICNKNKISVTVLPVRHRRNGLYGVITHTLKRGVLRIPLPLDFSKGILRIVQVLLIACLSEILANKCRFQIIPCITSTKRINFAIIFEIMADTSTEKNIITNRKAQHDYFIHYSYEAGIVLVGTEVKSLRQGRAALVDSYAIIQQGEVWLLNANINAYDQGSYNNHDPIRKRKLLLNKSEIRKISRATLEKGYTLIPLRLYFKEGKVKVELGVASGKKKYDKREDIAKRDLQRETLRKFK